MHHKFYPHRIINLLLVSLFLTISAYAQVSEKSDKPAVSQDLIKKLSALLPDAQEMKATLDGKEEFYGENLYELINGAAGIYHDYDFVALGHAIYKRGSDEITVDIYDMGNRLNAYGIFSAESSTDYNFIDIGATGYLEPDTLNFMQGRYYIKLSTYGEEGKTEPLLKDFSAQVSKTIKKGKKIPGVFKRFPKKNLVPHSYQFSNKAALGYKFLAPALIAEYALSEDKDAKTTLVLAYCKTPEEVKDRMTQLRERIAKTGTVEDLADCGPQAFHAQDKYRGEIIGFYHQGRNKSQYAVFIIKPPKDSVPFIQQIKKSLGEPKK
jgi:uncharacterized protein DUF6599